MICSPSANVPVVSDKDISLVFGNSLTNPIAPLVNPLTLEPDWIWDDDETFNMVNVWMS